MVTVIIDNVQSNTGDRLGDVQVTIDGETKVTDAKGFCVFLNIKPGRHEFRFYKDGFGCYVFPNHEVKDDIIDRGGFAIPKNVFITLSADKTKIKKNETVTIVAQLFKHDMVATGIKQVSFSINGTQKVISDFDTDNEIAVMTLKGSNQGKVGITATAQYIANSGNPHIAYSNVLYIQDGDEE